MLGPAAGVIGSLQALEALKLLAGLDGALLDAFLQVDLADHDVPARDASSAAPTARTAPRSALAHDRHRHRPPRRGELRRDVAAAHERDPAAAGVSALEILAAWPGVHALLAHRVAHALRRGGRAGRAARDRRTSRAR